MHESFSREDDREEWDGLLDAELEELMLPEVESPGPRALHSTEAVNQAVTGLSKRDLNRLTAAGYQYVRQYGLDPVIYAPEDLANEAMARTLDGRRGWRQDVALVKHLIKIMSSIASSWRKHDVRRADANAAELREADLRPEGADETYSSPVENAPERESDAQRALIARTDMEALQQEFRDAKVEVVTVLLKRWKKGEAGPEIRRERGISEKDYWAACQRLRRWARKEARDDD